MLPAPRIPDGYALVPVKPTRDMKRAGNNAFDGACLAHEDGIKGEAGDVMLQVYQAMIAAALQKTGGPK